MRVRQALAILHINRLPNKNALRIAVKKRVLHNHPNKPGGSHEKWLALQEAANLLNRNELQWQLAHENEENRQRRAEENRLRRAEENRIRRAEANRLRRAEENRLAREQANRNRKAYENRLAKEWEWYEQQRAEANRIKREHANRIMRAEANRIMRQRIENENREAAVREFNRQQSAARPLTRYPKTVNYLRRYRFPRTANRLIQWNQNKHKQEEINYNEAIAQARYEARMARRRN